MNHRVFTKGRNLHVFQDMYKNNNQISFETSRRLLQTIKEQKCVH